MKALFCLCAAVITTILSVSGASALTAPKPAIARTGHGIVKVHHRRHGHGGLFSNWCAYNCYSVSPRARGAWLGRYHYSHYLYDQDLPFHYRWDWDASPSDNVLGSIYPYTGDPFLRLFERTW